MNRQIGWSTESNLLWQIGNQIDRMTGVIGSTLSTFVPQSRTLTINGVTYDLSANRSWTVAAGLSGTIATGQVAFGSATNTISGTNNLFWNNAATSLGIGTNAPIRTLDVNGQGNFRGILFTPAGIFCDTALARFTNVTLGVNAGAGPGYLQPEDAGQPIAIRTGASFGGTERLRVTASTGNLLIGTTTDNGQRLQVNGDVYFKGSTTTSLNVQNTVNASTIRILNDGKLVFGDSPSIFFPWIACYDGQTNVPNMTGGTHLLFFTQNNDNSNGNPAGYGFVASFSSASGTPSLIRTSGTFANSTGTAGVAVVDLQYTINQTGTASGITRGLYIRPTLTSAIDWRSLQWDNNTGWGLYGAGTAPNYLGGDLTVVGVFRETVTTNRQTASYSLVLLDRGKLVEMNVASANNLTVPLDSAIAFPVGTKIDISQYGAGQTTVVATGGVTVRSAGGALKLAAQYSGATLVKIATNEWYLFGDITV